jgi:hypothetical protein
MSGKPSATLLGTVETIMKSPFPGKPERAQILIEGADHSYQETRIENTFTDDNSEEVRLKPGAKVQVTVRRNSRGQPFPRENEEGPALLL